MSVLVDKVFKPINLDFPTDTSEDHLTSLHPYPARFIPAIPRCAIRSLLKTGGVVWDPFAGAGTSMIEALENGHDAVGIDVNHLANFLQNTYLSKLKREEITSLHALAFEFRLAKSFLTLEEALRQYSRIPNLEHWFSPGSIRAVGSYLQFLETSGMTENAKSAAKMALSRVLVRISRQQSDTQYRAVKKDITMKSAIEIILKSLIEVAETMPLYQSRLGAGNAITRLGDARESATYDNLPAPDLIVTSPPYPNKYEYWLYHKYRMFWLDMDPIWSRSKEIGARPFYSGTGNLGPEDFASDMHKVLKNLTSVSKPSTLQVWVVGDGIIKGKPIYTSQVIANEAQELGWTILWQTSRAVQRKRSSFHGIGNLRREQILVMGRE